MTKKELPKFNYHQDPIKTGTFKRCELQECECCGELTNYTYTSAIYIEEELECLCPLCIANGAAYHKFGAQFTSELADEVAPEIEETVLHKTPGYSGNQEEIWLTHCEDACCFIDYVSWLDIEEQGLKKELLANYDSYEHYNDLDIQDLIEGLTSGEVAGYLFKCLHCGIPMLHNDVD